MEITKIIQVSQGDYRVEIKFKSGKMLAGIISPSLARGIMSMADIAAFSKVGDVITYEFEFGQQPKEPQLWLDEDLIPSEPAEGPITYTSEDMFAAFEAGVNRKALLEPEGLDPFFFAPDFAQFMDGLNTSKSRP